MIFDYNGNRFKCVWRTLMDKNMWYNMEPAKIKVTIPKSLYQKMMKDVKTDVRNNTLLDIVRFKIQKPKGESLYFNESNKDELEYWEVNAYLESATISSTFNQKNPNKQTEVTVHFKIKVFENKKLTTSEIRDILLNEIL